ncbi:MAG: glycosyltransferase [Ginsengibacter sp.]
MISIVIPLYNKAAFIAEAIYSVTSQTSEDFEIVVINNGSLGYSLKIIQSLKDSRILIMPNRTWTI